jgi:hypothetical protein
MTDAITFTSVAPVLRVQDLAAALERYRGLGFTTETYDGPARYGFVDRGGVALHLTQWGQFDPARGGATIYLYVSDADALYAEWSQAGAAGRLEPPHDTDYGLREFVFVDDDGTVHRVGSPLTQPS